MKGGFIAELRRRHVFRVMIAYLAAAWLLIQVLETLFPIFGVSETSIQVVVVILAIGFIPAVILSWVFEWTPAGLQRDADVTNASGDRRRNTRTLDRIIIATLTIAVLFFAIDEFVFDVRSEADWRAAADRAKAFSETVSTDKLTVAVLPFRNVSSNPEHAHFAIGLSEEVLNSLAAIEDLRITSRTSSFALDEKDITVGEIAAILGVDHVLEGSVRRAGDQVRVTATLIDASSDVQLWSESFDRQLTVGNVFDIQSEIAAHVVGALDVSLAASIMDMPRTSGPLDLRALDLYHDGLYAFRQMDTLADDGASRFEVARKSFEAAISIDPGWAPPYARLGAVYHAYKPGGDDSDEWLEISEGYIKKALELDPDFGPAHGSIAYLQTVKGDYAGALQQYDRAIALGSNLAHWGKGITLRMLGRNEEAIAEYLAAAAIDPLSEIARFQLFETYYCAGRFEDSIDGLTQFLSIDPGFIYGQILLARAHAQVGNTTAALKQADDIAARIGDETALATVFALAGENERARRALEDVTVADYGPFIILDVVPAAVLVGEHDRAIALLEEAADFVLSEMNLSDRYSWLWRARCSPVFRQLEGDTRYESILARLGLSR